eukprot:g7418.t1
MWSSCCWSQARRTYHAGKVEARKVQIPILSSQKDTFLEAMRRDVSWLAGQRLMDYSLLVAIKDHKETPTKGLPAGQPYVRQTSEGPIAVQMSIIDFLQRWTMGKRVARAIKVFERSLGRARRKVNVQGLMSLQPKAEDPLPSFTLDKSPEEHRFRAESSAQWTLCFHPTHCFHP